MSSGSITQSLPLMNVEARAHASSEEWLLDSCTETDTRIEVIEMEIRRVCSWEKHKTHKRFHALFLGHSDTQTNRHSLLLDACLFRRTCKIRGGSTQKFSGRNVSGVFVRV
jgi:hypothetical protein